ncbi:hypothetical protein AF2641_05310 [Anoxybacillus flavithermus]|nr:hypothetical protein AF2641_05310 [Anoxybacillus flavithermus]
MGRNDFMSSINFMNIIEAYVSKEIEMNKVRDKIKLENNLKEGLIKQLEIQLTPLVLNVLFSEYEGFKQYYKLNSSDALNKYYEKIKEDKYFIGLSEHFPVMREKLDKRINHFITYVNEIIENLEIHKTKTNYKKVTDIKLALGDTHNNGKTVCHIKIDGKDYIYKPRNAALDINFINFVSKYIPDYKYEIYNYGDFSIHEMIHVNQNHTNQESVNKYYYNIGFLSAIFYFIGATDMHYENVIVNGATPIFIDLETISDITDFESGKNHNNLFQLLSNSIFQSMIYPFEMNENYLNISALTGEKGKVLKFHYTNAKPVINADGELEFLEENPSLEKQKNEVFLNNIKQIPSMYIADIVKGFSDFCKIVLDNKDSVFNELIKVVEGHPIRQVVRPTHVYEKYLNVLLEPYYLKEKGRDQELFNHLRHSRNDKIVNEEIISLKQGDVPLFYTYFDSKHLYARGDCIIENYFSTTIKENIQNRIYNFDTNKMKQEINNIYSSLLIYHYNHTDNKILNNHPEFFTDEISPFVFLKDFYNLFQSINSSSSALLPSFSGKKMIISPITPSIYEYGGNLLLIIYFRDKIGVSVQEIIKIFKTMKEWKTYNNAELTGFNGVGAYIYLVYNAYRITGEKWFYNELLNEIQNLSIPENVNNIDYFTGLAGTVTILSEIKLNMNEPDIKEPLEKLLKSAVEIIHQKYKDMMKDDKRIGLAHGYSGLILALSRYDSTNKNYNNQALINNLIEAEEEYFNSRKNNYIDLRDNTYDKYFICYGIVGILFSRIELLENGFTHFKEDITEKSLKLCNDILNNTINLDDYSYCLCHGIGGLIELFEELKRLEILNEKLYREVNNKLFSYLDKNNLNGINNNFIYSSFMLGYGGKAYNKLRNKYNIPSILRLKSF